LGTPLGSVGGVRRALVGLTCAAALCAAPPVTAQAQLTPGDIVVADRTADPAGLGGDTGAVFKVDPATGAVSVLATSPQFRAPFGVAIDSQGNLLVVDQDADPAGLGGDTGAVFRFAPGSPPAALATSSLFGDPVGIAIDPQGNVVLADSATGPAGDAGAVFRFAPGSPPGTLAIGPPLDRPTAVAFDALGNIVVADLNADPAGFGGDTGAVFRFTPGSPPGTLAATPEFRAPEGVAVDVQGNVLVGDSNARPFGPVGGNVGAIFRFAPGNPPQILAASTDFSDPSDVAIDAQGNVVVADYAADPGGFGGDAGAIFRFAPGSPPSVLAASPLFKAPQGVAVVPPRCGGRFATIVGDAAGNLLRGTQFADVIAAGASRDRVLAGKGNDIVCGGPGKDVLKGQKGRDRLLGEGGKDKLFGGNGRDVLKGGKGRDLLVGGKGRDKERQ
jgi:Ca2+-binding RTX toxin-like protein